MNASHDDWPDLFGKYLRNELTANEQAEMERQLAASEEKRALFAYLTSADTIIGHLRLHRELDTAAGWQKLEAACEALRPSPVAIYRKVSFRRNVAIAIAVIIVASALLRYFFQPKTDSPETMIAKTILPYPFLLLDGDTIRLDEAYRDRIKRVKSLLFSDEPHSFAINTPNVIEKKMMNMLYNPTPNSYRLQLPDSSVVELNDSSALIFASDFGQDSRHLYLKGEAYFVVCKDNRHPFVVSLSDTAQLQVLSTRFNISNYDHQPKSLTVVNGAVRVKTASDNQVVSAREQYRFDGKVKKTLTDSVMKREITWMDKDIVFDREDIKTILFEVARRYHLGIMIQGDISQQGHSSAHFTGRQTLEDILKVLSEENNLDIQQANDLLIVRMKKE